VSAQPARGIKPCTKQLMLDAAKRGAFDFAAGNHMNPFSWVREREQFNAWIVGYAAAKKPVRVAA
jgi:hypothetical protein